MATLEEIGQALKNAHDAGDIDAAKKLADAYHAQQQQQEKKTLNPTSQNESPVDVAARMGVRTLAAFPETVIDMPLTAGNWIGNKIDAAVNLPPADFNTHPVKDLADKAISMMGVSPQSSGSTENIAQAGLSALTGAGLAKTLRSSLGKYAMRQAAGAASAQTANEITQDSDLSDELKIGLGIGAGMLGSNMMGAAESGIKLPTQTMNYVFSPEERKNAAGRALYRQTANPELVIERLQNPSLRETFVPNSLPTTPEIAYDTGLSQLGRALAANPYANSTGASEVFNARLGDISKHADDYLQQMNRQNLSYDPAVVVRDYRQNVMTPFRAENDLNAININPDSLKKTFEDLLSAHSGNEQIQGFIKSNVKNIFPESTINRLPNETYEIAISDAPTFNRVWNARQGVDSTLFSPEFATLARDKYSSNALNNAAMKMRTAMNESLVDAKPEFADNLKKYHAAASYENALLTGRKLANQLFNNPTVGVDNIDDIAGVNRISTAKTSNLGDKLKNLYGEDSTLTQSLLPDQVQGFENLAKEMQRAKALETLGAAQGSPTASYLGRGGLLRNDVLDYALGTQASENPGVLRLVGSSISAPIEKLGFLAPFEEDVMREIKNGLLSPDYGLDLLKRGKATVQGPMDVRKALINNTGAGLTGLLYNR